MSNIWFKAKTYGYGWYPATWQGWLCIAAWTAAMVIGLRAFVATTMADPTNFWLSLYFVTYVSVLTATLISVCIKKGEKARWSWGKSKNPKK
jgi:FtsH-binding integral membrane protein